MLPRFLTSEENKPVCVQVVALSRRVWCVFFLAIVVGIVVIFSFVRGLCCVDRLR